MPHSPFSGDPLLEAALIALLCLLGATGLLSIATLLLNVRRQRTAERQHAAAARWEPLLLQVMTDDAPPERLSTAVRASERMAFIQFALPYTLVLEGDGRARIAVAAAPHLSLLHRLLRHRDPIRRAFAVRALGALGGRAALPLLCTALRDRTPLVAFGAAAALARTGVPVIAYADSLIDALDRFDGFGASAVASMLAGHGLALRAALTETLQDAHRSEPARVAAAEALRRLGDVGAAAAAERVLAETASREITAAALRLLRAVGRPDQVAAASCFLASPDPVVRLHAVAALSSLGSAADAPLLQHALDDESVWVAVRAAHGLRELGARGTLQEIAESPHPRAALARQTLAA